MLPSRHRFKRSEGDFHDLENMSWQASTGIGEQCGPDDFAVGGAIWRRALLRRNRVHVGSIAELAFQFPVGSQHLDAIYGRATTGRGVVGEGGEVGPGVVGIAGGVIGVPTSPGRGHLQGADVGRGLRVGVLGFGGNPDGRGEEKGGGDAVGVLGESEKNLGVLGVLCPCWRVRHVQNDGLIGDGRRGQIGIEGFGSMYGVYGHVDYGNPNPDSIGVFGAAASRLGGGSPTGRAGVFVGPVEVNGDLTVLENFAVWGTKSAAVRHDDGKGRLLYCLESPECYIEDSVKRRWSKVRRASS